MRRGCWRVALVLWLWVFRSAAVVSGEPGQHLFSAWEQIGVGGGGHLTAIAIAPLEPPLDYAVLTGLDCGGAFVSYDRGDSWIPLGEGLYPEPHTKWPGFGTEAVAFDPQDKTRTTLWSATRWDSGKGRILCGRERDGRFVWEERFQSRHPIGSIVFAPSRPERVYAAAGSRRSVLNRWGSPTARGRYWPCEPEVYRSDDGGKAWRKVGLLPVLGESKHGHVFSLAVPPDDPNRVYAASDRGVYRSADGGQTWQELGGLPHRCAFGLALDPKRQRTLYATLLAFEDLRNLAATKANATALFRSSDDGRTWQRLSVLDHPPFFAPGIWGSTTQFFDVVVNPASPSRLYVACTGDKDSAVFRSEDSGKTWQRLDKHKPGFLPWFFPQVLALHAPSQGEDHVFVLGATAGQYRSLDGGRQFEPFASERLGSGADPRWRGYGLEADGALSVAAAGDPNKPDYLLRAEMDWGISLSYDYGITFRHVDSPWNAGCRGACLDPSNQRIIYGIFHPFWAFGPRFVRSVDGGKTFDAEPRPGLPKLQFTDLAVDSRHLAADDAARKRRLYVCLQSRPGRDEVQMGGVYASSDGGATWKLTDDGQPGLRFPNRVLVHPQKPDMVFATQLQGSKRSGSLFRKDGASGWRPLGAQNGLPADAEAYALGASTSDSATALLAAIEVWDEKRQTRTRASGIHRSGDDGQTWTQVFSDPERRINRFASVDDKEAYAATTKGVLRTDDGGTTWHDFSAGLPLPGRATHVDVVRTTPFPTIYVGMEGGGHVRCRRLPFPVVEFKRKGEEHYLCRPRMVVPGMRAHLDSAWSVESFPSDWRNPAELVNLGTLQRDVRDDSDDLYGIRLGSDAVLFVALDEAAEPPRWLAQGWTKQATSLRLRYRDNRWHKQLALWSREVKSGHTVRLGGQSCGASRDRIPSPPVQYLVFAR